MSRWREAECRDYGEFGWDAEPASEEEIKACIAAAPSTVIWGGNYFGELYT
jgi:hypothetical protein